MKVALGLIRYVIGLALFVAGALVVGIHVGAVLKGAPPTPEGAGMAQQVLELVRNALGSTAESPVWHVAPGLLLAALGLIVARPPLKVSLALRKPPEQKKSLRAIVHELSHPDDGVRLKAARILSREAKPSTIPALIKALLDKTTEVRGEACEALEKMTGLTFDYVDIAPEPVRKESVKQWLAWWQGNKAAILAGADPKTVGGGAEAAAPPGEEELPGPDEEVGIGRPTPAPGALGALGRRTPVPMGGVSRQTPVPGSRNLSPGELIRRKRAREGTPLPGALGAVLPPAGAAPAEAGEGEEAPAGPDGGPSPAAPAEGGASADAGGEGISLPPPEEDLPPPE